MEDIESYDRRNNLWRQTNMFEETGTNNLGVTWRAVGKKRDKTQLKRDVDKDGFFKLLNASLLQTGDQVIDVVSTKLEKEYLL